MRGPSAFGIIKARKDSHNAENQIGLYLYLVTNCFPRETDRKNYCHQNKSVAILVHLCVIVFYQRCKMFF